MKSILKTITFLAVLLLLPLIVGAQADSFGKLDTLYVDMAKVNDYNWSITVSYTNDEWVEALSIPLRLSAGNNRLVGDSAVFTGGRVEKFDFKGFRADTAVQCITIGLMANLGPSKHALPPGNGRLVTAFVSSMDKKPIENLTVDSTTTHPNNSLMVMAQRVQAGDPPDTIPLERFDDLKILPALVVRQSK